MSEAEKGLYALLTLLFVLAVGIIAILFIINGDGENSNYVSRTFFVIGQWILGVYILNRILIS